MPAWQAWPTWPAWQARPTWPAWQSPASQATGLSGLAGLGGQAAVTGMASLAAHASLAGPDRSGPDRSAREPDEVWSGEDRSGPDRTSPTNPTSLGGLDAGWVTKVASLNKTKVKAYFESDAVCLNRKGKAKSQLTVDKTRRVFRQALEWLAEVGVLKEAPIPQMKTPAKKK